MKFLLSTLGSRGDVQPLVALGCQLRAHGHVARLCVAPNFRSWVEEAGLECAPIGPDVEQWVKSPAAPKPASAAFTPAGTVHEQFEVIGAAARDCDALVAAGVLQLAARSIAAARGVPCVFAAYAPVVLRSPDHPPPTLMPPFHPLTLGPDENRALWRHDGARWNQLFGPSIDENRARLGLPPVDDVYAHIFGDRPWLACDPVLGPVPATDVAVLQTGAWLLDDDSPLPAEVERFLDAGEPPIYFGFGSMRGAEAASADVIAAARALERRALVSGGWGGLRAIDAGADCLVIGPTNHARLFRRVCAVVHHGGAGTTTAAAAAGAAQVLVPHNYDQFYWARRIELLGGGAAGPDRAGLTTDSLVAALRAALAPEVRARARERAGRIARDGALHSAERLERMVRERR